MEIVAESSLYTIVAPPTSQSTWLHFDYRQLLAKVHSPVF